jgi:hypothetical protein
MDDLLAYQSLLCLEPFIDIIFASTCFFCNNPFSELAFAITLMDISFTVTDDPLKGAPLLSAILATIISNANNEKEMEKKIGRNDFFTARTEPVCKFLISKQLS